MPNIYLCFQVHAPTFLKPYRFFDLGVSHEYFDEIRTINHLNLLCDDSFLPANAFIKELINKHREDFRMGMVISGSTLRLFEKYRPDVLKSFQELIATGNIELLAQNDDFSLSFMFDREEYQRQLDAHKTSLKKLFAQEPEVIATTAGLYSNPMGYYLQKIGYKGALCGGNAAALKDQNIHQLYHPTHLENMKLMFSDDEIGKAVESDFGINDLDSSGLVNWISNISGEIVHLFWNYSMLGHLQPKSSGIFDFFEHFTSEIIKSSHISFQTPSEVFQNHTAHGAYDMPGFSVRNENHQSYFSNFLQQEALSKLYELKKSIEEKGDEDLLNIWRQLQSADFFREMGFKNILPDHSEANYSRFMNIITDMQKRLLVQKVEE